MEQLKERVVAMWKEFRGEAPERASAAKAAD
jgi:hypothetical protein